VERERAEREEAERREAEAEAKEAEAQEMKRTAEEKRRAEVRRASERKIRDEQIEINKLNELNKRAHAVDSVDRQESKARRKFKLTPERRRKLKLLIMKKAMEALKDEADRRDGERKEYLATKVKPLNLDGLTENEVIRLCESLYRRILELQGETYDLEMKLCQQDFEINEAVVRVNDIKGKFVKPILNRVSKTQTKLARMQEQHKGSQHPAHNTNLRQVDKFTTELSKGLKNEESAETPEWHRSRSVKGSFKERTKSNTRIPEEE